MGVDAGEAPGVGAPVAAAGARLGGTIPVTKSYPQSSQKMLSPSLAPLQLGHVPTVVATSNPAATGVGVDVEDAGDAAGFGVAVGPAMGDAAPSIGGTNATGPSIFTPH